MYEIDYLLAYRSWKYRNNNLVFTWCGHIRGRVEHWSDVAMELDESSVIHKKAHLVISDLC